MDALYVIGEPGSGKSTLVAAITEGLPYEEADQPFAHRRYDAGPLELGKRREAFSGTDALPLNVQPAVHRFLEGVRPRLLLGEGDRLANASFFAHLRTLGYALTIVYLDAGEASLERRIARGSHQNEAWLRGRATKVKRLAMTEPGVQFIDATVSAAAIVEQLTDPVTDALRAGVRS